MKKLFFGLLGAALSSSAFGAASQVTIQGRRLLVDGTPYTIQGVNYSPVPYGRTVALTSNGCVGLYTWWTDRPAYIADFPLIARMGANTIRTFDLMNSTGTSASVLQALDAAHANGLKVVMGYSIPVFATFSASTATVRSNVLTSVANYKDHPAVLMWMIGNEVNLAAPQGFDATWSTNFWFNFLDSLAQEIKQLDPNHPVGTAEGEIVGVRDYSIGSVGLQANDANISNVDLWGVNAYRGTTFQGLFYSLSISTMTTKPIYMSEFGKDAYRDSAASEDAAMQATYLSAQWQEIKANLSATGAGLQNLIGGTVFEWTDEWWKTNQNSCFVHDTNVLFTRAGDSVDPNYQDEWFGIASVLPTDAVTNPAGTQRVLRAGYTSLQSFWNPAAAASAGSGSFFSGTVRNYPNPFRIGSQDTKFVILANEAGRVDLRIYDAGAQFVTSLARDVQAGRSEILWDGRNRQGALVAPGLYFVRVHGQGAHEETQFRRIVGVK